MRTILSVTFLLAVTALTALSAQAAPNIEKGSWETGGAFNFSHSSTTAPRASRSRSTSLGLYTSTQYFFADQFSAGLEGSAFTGSGFNSFSAGPVFTKYLWVEDKLAPYISMLPLKWTKSEGFRHYLSSSARVGAKYFVTDSVAVGPALDYDHVWSSNGTPEVNTFSLLGLFSIHF